MSLQKHYKVSAISSNLFSFFSTVLAFFCLLLLNRENTCRMTRSHKTSIEKFLLKNRRSNVSLNKSSYKLQTDLDINWTIMWYQGWRALTGLLSYRVTSSQGQSTWFIDHRFIIRIKIRNVVFILREMLYRSWIPDWQYGSVVTWGTAAKKHAMGTKKMSSFTTIEKNE